MTVAERNGARVLNGHRALRLTIRAGEARGESVVLDEGRVVLGRAEDCELVVPDPRVSRRHAAVEPRPDGRASLVDLGSGNGTFVDGHRVQTAVLEGHEQIQVGDTILVSSRGEAAPGATILGRSPGTSHSALYRLTQRSVRRAFLLSGLAIAVAGVLAVALATGMFGSGEGAAEAVERVVNQTESSTVSIDSGSRGGGGTGWVLDASAGLIVTNAHVVDGAGAVKVGVGGELRRASRVGVSPCEDLAVVHVDDSSGLKALPMGREADVRRGQTVVAVGYPTNASLEADLTATTGVVSVVHSAYREQALDIPRFPDVIQTDAAINPGSSGGPLLDLRGRLIGVNSAGRTVTPDGRIVQGQNYAIGVDRVEKVTRVLRTGRSIAWTGASFDYLTPDELGERGLPAGLVVSGAVPGTAAERAGLGVRESVLVAVNGRPVDNTLASYCDAVDGVPARQPLTFSLRERGSAALRKAVLAVE